MKDDDFFIGWQAKAPRADRRFLLAAGIAAVAGAGGLATLVARREPQPGPGRWDQADIRDWRGRLMRDPYPTLLMRDANGETRAALLVSPTKVAVGARIPDAIGEDVIVRASAIVHGAQMMLAVVDGRSWMRAAEDAMDLQPVAPIDKGPLALAGEILDAKCWFGAMNPGWGLTHKACAILCARGGLPLAFCAAGACGGLGDLMLFVDGAGRPHSRDILPFLADPVFAQGRLVRRNGLDEFRADLADVRRI